MRLAVAALACASLLAPAAALGQGLGGVAKKEQQRRAKVPATPAKTYADADLKRQGDGLGADATEKGTAEPREADSTSSGEQQAALGSSSAQNRDLDAESARRRHDEEAWRTRVAAARGAVEAARGKHAFLAGLTLVPGYVFVDGSGRTVIHSIEQLQRMTARAKADLDAAERALADLLETARRANVPPGWLR